MRDLTKAKQAQTAAAIMTITFNPEIFEELQSHYNPKERRCKLAVVDSFAIYITLQLLAKGKASDEHTIPFSKLRPILSPSNDRRKDKDILFLLELLQSTGMIWFKLEKGEICYKIAKAPSKKLSKTGKPRKPVKISKSDARILEDFKSNVPFAIYCLLRSIQQIEQGVFLKINISIKGISKRLHIKEPVTDEHLHALEEKGYIYRYSGTRNTAANSFKNHSNKYTIFRRDHPLSSDKYRLRMMKRELLKSQKQRKPRRKKSSQTIGLSQDIVAVAGQTVDQTYTIPTQDVTRDVPDTTGQTHPTHETAPIQTTQDTAVLIEGILTNAKPNETYLLIGKLYGAAFDEAYDKVKYIKPILLFDVGDDFNEYIEECNRMQCLQMHIVIFRLKNKALSYQERLLVVLERITLPLLVLVDEDNLSDIFVSRFKSDT